MLPYNEIQAISEQKMDRFRSQAERHRLIERPHREKHRIAAVQQVLARSGLRRIGAVIIGSPNRPIQPAT